MKPASRASLRLGLTGLILVMLVLFARKVNWHDTWHTMQDASLPILLAAAAREPRCRIVVKGVRWWVFLRPIGATSLPLALRATFAGAGLNNVLVANGGEAARVVFVARAAHVPSAKVLATLALERLFELVGYVVLLSLAATFLQLPHSLERVKPFAIAILVAHGRRCSCGCCAAPTSSRPSPARSRRAGTDGSRSTARGSFRPSARSRAARAFSPRCCSAWSPGRFRCGRISSRRSRRISR